MKKTKQVSLEEDVIEAVEKQAKITGHTFASMLRYIVNQYVETLKKQ